MVKIKTFSTDELSPKDRYQLLIGFVTPRPVALVGTRSLNGVSNLAPFSFYNAVSANPPILMVSFVDGPNGTSKDSLRNILDTQEFTINTMNEKWLEKTHCTSESLEFEQSEFFKFKLTEKPSIHIQSPRLEESYAQAECILESTHRFGNCTAVFGKVLCFHIHQEVLEQNTINPLSLKNIGRLGGNFYSKSTELIEISRK